MPIKSLIYSVPSSGQQIHALDFPSSKGETDADRDLKKLLTFSGTIAKTRNVSVCFLLTPMNKEMQCASTAVTISQML